MLLVVIRLAFFFLFDTVGCTCFVPQTFLQNRGDTTAKDPVGRNFTTNIKR